MATTLEELTIGKGYDPRDFSLLAYGGGGPLVAAALAKRLHIPKVIVPPSPATFSAWGMLTLDIVHDFSDALSGLDVLTAAVSARSSLRSTAPDARAHPRASWSSGGACPLGRHALRRPGAHPLGSARPRLGEERRSRRSSARRSTSASPDVRLLDRRSGRAHHAPDPGRRLARSSAGAGRRRRRRRRAPPARLANAASGTARAAARAPARSGSAISCPRATRSPARQSSRSRRRRPSSLLAGGSRSMEG